MTSAKKVVVLGAHPEPSRFAHRALQLLEDKGHDTVAINPRFQEVRGRPCWPSLSAWAQESGEKADTVTFYLNPTHSSKLKEELIAHKPRRAIFNPGAENPELEKALRQAGVEVLEACTLVLLNSGRF